MKKQFIIISTFSLMLLASIGFGERSSSEDLNQVNPPPICPAGFIVQAAWSNLPIEDWIKDPEAGPLLVQCPDMTGQPNTICCNPLSIE
jgi:hypothetical protein